MLAWLSGMRCRLAYSPADATVLPFWYLLTRVVPDIFHKSSKTVVCVCVCVSESVLLVCYDLTYLTRWLYCVECPQHSTRYLAQSTQLSVHQRLNSMSSNLSETRSQTKFCLLFFIYLFCVITAVIWCNNSSLLATLDGISVWRHLMNNFRPKKSATIAELLVAKRLVVVLWTVWSCLVWSVLDRGMTFG